MTFVFVCAAKISLFNQKMYLVLGWRIDFHYLCGNFRNRMKIKELVCALESFAPLPLQESYDNAGLQLGLTESETTGALLCLDVTEPVIDEAIALGFNLIVSHHPLLFKGVKSISGSTYVERCILKAIKNDIAIYSAHTNLDNTVGGVNFKIAEKIGLRDVTFLTPSQNDGISGSGIIGTLSEPETETDFLRRIKKLFEVGCLRHNKMTGRQIQRVAICGGAGAFLIPDAIAAAADVFITGEIRYHEYFGHEREILLAEIGHYESEQYTKELLAEYLQRQFPGLKVEQTKINTNPIKYL